MKKNIFLNGLDKVINDLEARKKTGTMEMKINFRCGGIGSAKISVTQDFNDVIAEQNGKVAIRTD